MCNCLSCEPERPSAGRDAGVSCGATTQPCPSACQLVSLTVISGATQNGVPPPKTWATVQREAAYVIVEATTTPNTPACWQQIAWSGDTGDAVPGKANQRKLSRAQSQRLHVEAQLGGVNDALDVWVLWATIQILTSGQVPANAVQFFSGMRDGTQRLGAVTFESIDGTDYSGDYVRNMGASGKVAPVATLTPVGVHRVVTSGWAFKRERWTHDWSDGFKLKEGNGHSDFWNTTWVDDTSPSTFLKLTPDDQDRIYDLDAPDLRHGGRNYETYNNFRQWIEWNGERCSDSHLWNWNARWQANRNQRLQIQLNELGTTNKTLPDQPFYR